MNCGGCTMIWGDSCQGCHYAECGDYTRGVFYCADYGFGTGICRYNCVWDAGCIKPDGTPKCG